MDDYISRKKFALHLADIQYGEAPTGREGENLDYLNGVCAGFDMAYVALSSFPPADVRPVVRGHWVRKEHPSPIVEAFCSNCGDPALRAYGHPARTNYCPNCGADMRPEPPEREVEA